MKYFVEIHLSGGSSERHELHEGVVTLGSGPEDAVRLADNGRFAPCMLRLDVQTTHVSVSTTETSLGRLSLHGIIIPSAEVTWGDEAFLGALRLKFIAEVKAAKSRAPFLLAVAVVLGALVVGARALSADGIEQEEIDAPSLLDPARTCSESNPSKAIHVAESASVAARAKEQRFPFSRKDGVEALRLHRDAASCFTKAGDARAAEEAKNGLERWSRTMAEEYTSLRLQLRVALEASAHPEALAAARALESLLSAAEVPTDHPYRSWLSQVTRRIEKRVAKRK